MLERKNSKTLAISIIVGLIGLVAWSSFSFTDFLRFSSKYEPGQHFSQKLITNEIHFGDTLDFIVKLGDVDHCDVYSLRRLFKNDQLFSIQLGRPKEGFLRVPLFLFKGDPAIPLPPGEYDYQATIHLVCHEESYVRSTPVYHFKIVP